MDIVNVAFLSSDTIFQEGNVLILTPVFGILWDGAGWKKLGYGMYPIPLH